MRFKPWALGLTLAGAALLSACGGGGSSSSTNVRLLNASVSYSALDLSVNSKSLNAKVAYGGVGAYGSVDTGSTASQVLDSSNGSAVVSLTPTLAGNSNYTIIAYGWAGAVRTTLLQETEPNPDANKAKLLLLNLAADAGALDLYVTAANGTGPLTSSTPIATNIIGGSGYNLLNSGAFRLTLTGTGKPNDIRLDLPSVTLDSATVQTLIATSTTGGKLVNGIVLKQQGSTANYLTTSARARVVNGVASASAPVNGVASSAGTSVSATLNSQPLLTQSLAPVVGQYVTTKAGASTLAVTLNGVPVTVAAPTLTAGGDYTLLVSGTVAAPVVSVISDDNRLPSTAGYTKVRLMNGVSTAAGASMQVDFASVASNVLPGFASTPQLLTSLATGSRVNVALPTANPPLQTLTGVNFTANAVFTVFVLGDSVVPYTVQINRDDLVPAQ
ncbi:DUF4397 domain-containing protein [Paucibacter sp. KCTC 42545]|uniref:DUF4397 domain-containing protein n=1 Tax=Paucibacter sp. KCTC 42545 TaxID=1768242 RepID=UPI000733C3DD|nr:DUF4397 domain-containing protein [Paucibacter sp. KCTC 42545]ALT78917.1 hypothetical protein AT984_18710 [Paucibacter sp. KCTC 42545]